jgi:thiamine-phosphate diphosphorylase
VRGAPFVGLHVLVDDDPRWGCNPVVQARQVCGGGPQVIQLRTKHTSDGRVLEWAREIRALTREYRVRFVVNDRFDLALAAEADGVHLGQKDLPPESVPEWARRRLAIGRSTHSLEQARTTLHEPVDYLAFGPVFGTSSKVSEYGARGLALLEEVATLVSPRPLVAIGGIGEEDVTAVIAAGAAGVAVVSAVAQALDREATTRRLAQRLEEASRA